MHRPSDRDVNWMSPVQGMSPPVQVKEPYDNLWAFFLQPGVYKVHLPIILERGSGSIEKERKKDWDVKNQIKPTNDIVGV